MGHVRRPAGLHHGGGPLSSLRAHRHLTRPALFFVSIDTPARIAPRDGKNGEYAPWLDVPGPISRRSPRPLPSTASSTNGSPTRPTGECWSIATSYLSGPDTPGPYVPARSVAWL